MKSLGILLTTGPEREDSALVGRLAQAALDMGVKVYIFLSADGIYDCFDKRFLSLQDKGASITICEQSARDRGIDVEAPVTKGSLYDFSIIVGEVDRVISFT